ncbi:MAG: DUF1326 domain-containing protein [Chloroflexi bacterium]|nr:DUF1326 domain-containing protein [Chloroflexota bacterium]
MATETKTKWAIEADYYQACNCDYGCPCEFQAPPSMGYCDGLGAWNIKGGKFGDVSLNGLGFGFALKSPGALHEGNLTLALFIDEKASEEQRDSILQICSGQHGGMPFEIIAQLVGNMLEPQIVSFAFDGEGRNSSVKLGDKLSMAFAPIKNPVTGEPEAVRIEHETGFIFQGADVVSAEVCEVSIDGLNFSWPGKNGFVTQVSYAN